MIFGTSLLIWCVVSLLLLAASVPLILGKVRPNSMYGFRTPKTLSSPEVWYPANRAAGSLMAGAAAISVGFNLVLWWTSPEWPPERTLFWMFGGFTIPPVVAVAASFVVLRRL